MLVKQLIYVLLLQHLVVQLSFVCGIRLHMLLFESLWMLQRYSSVTQKRWLNLEKQISLAGFMHLHNSYSGSIQRCCSITSTNYILVVQLNIVCKKAAHVIQALALLILLVHLHHENKRFSTSNAGSMVVKLFDSLVHGCYSGSYFVEIHFIIWPLRGGYSWGTQGRRFYDFIFRFDSQLLIRTLILTIALLCTYILVCGIWSLRFRNS